ncbi:MAG: SDR family oxidoreductase [Hyphomicrobiales bacterium]
MANKVLVAGASGLVGHAAIEEFASMPGWQVVGVSRRTPNDVPGAGFLSVDLLDAGACERTFEAMGDVTHLVYAALQEEPGLMPGWLDAEVMERNAAMLRNLFEPLSRVATGLQHVTLLHGTKAYGLHHPSVGYAGVRIPLRERDPRNEHPNFYFLQEDYLREKQRGQSWAITVYRPTVIYGDAPGNNMNPTLAIAVYAALLRERGEPLHFPGRGAERVLREAVDARLVARAIAWGATAAGARKETFNLTNGDVFTWEGVWPAIAETLGMKVGEHRPMSFATDLPKQDPEWAALVEKHGLHAARSIVEFVGYNSLVYADVMMAGVNPSPVPALNSTIKARQAGFHDCMDTEDMFRQQFASLQERGVIPRP